MPEFLEMMLGGFALSATVWLGLGLWLSHTLKQTPAKAHGILVASLIGNLVAPLFFWLVSQANWGMLPARVDRAGATSVNPEAVEQGISITVPVMASNPDQGMRLGNRPEPFSPPEAFGGVDSGSTNTFPPVSTAPLSWKHWVLVVWIGLTVILFLRLLLDFGLGYRLFRSSHLIQSQEVNQELETLSRKMGNRVIPQLATSNKVPSPVLWAWSRPARILIPQGIDGKEIPEGVYLHELAHLARKDHVWAFLGELVLCLLPWHPFAWITRRQLSDRAEEACDDWVIACGCQPLDYADELVKLAPSRVGVLTMAAVSKRSRLKERVSRLVAGIISSPKLSQKWIFGLVVSGCLLVLSLAVVQPQSLKAEALPKSSEGDGQNPEKTPKSLSGEDKPGKENLPDQKIQILHKGVPVPGAKLWIEKLVFEDIYVKRIPIKDPLISDKDGLVHNFDYSTLKMGLNLGFARSDNGLLGIVFVFNSLMVEKNLIELKTTKPIKGRIEHDGKPLSGVRCQLISLKSLNDDGNFEVDRSSDAEYDIPKGSGFKEVQSDEKGGFSFEGIPDGFAGNVLLDKDGFGLAKVAIIGGQNPVIQLVPSGDLQIVIQGKVDPEYFARTRWSLMDLGETGASTPGFRRSFSRSFMRDSITSGKLARLGAGKYRLASSNFGSVPFLFHFSKDVEIAPGKTTRLEIKAEPAAEISGRLVDETTGKGVGGVEVVISGKKETGSDYEEHGVCISKNDGSFSVYCIGDKKYSIRAYHLGIPNFKINENRYYQKRKNSWEDYWIQIKAGEKIKIPDEAMVPGLRYQANVVDSNGQSVQNPFQVIIAEETKLKEDAIATRYYALNNDVQITSGKFLVNQLNPFCSTSFLVRKGKEVNNPEALRIPGKLSSKEIVLSEEFATSVKGILVNDQGKPIPKRGVELHYRSYLVEKVQTKEDGSFEFSGIWLNQKYHVSVSGVFDSQINPGVDFQSPKNNPEKIEDLKIILK